MSNLTSSFKDRKIIIIIILIILLVLLSVTIFLINSKQKNPLTTNSNMTLENELINHEKKLDQILTAKEKSDKEYIVLKQLLELTRTEKEVKEKYKNYKAASDKVQLLYSLYNNSALYSYINEDMNNFAKKNYQDYYEESAFDYPCQDSKCADSQQPAEILTIIEDLKASDLPEVYKNNYIQNLKNTGYESNKNPHSKAWQYFMTAKSLENSSDLSPSGVNLLIANKISEFIKSKYPSDYESFSKVQTEINKVSPQP